jgi:predicted nucleic acid-binding protein
LTFLVDTNVFIYAAEQSSSEHARCRDLVQAWQQRLEPSGHFDDNEACFDA